MRTPGNDEELAAGFLLAEGFIANAAELGEIRRVRDAKGAREPNVIDVILNVRAEGLRERLKRNFTISSSCGVCGKTSIDSITRRIAPIASRAKIAARRCWHSARNCANRRKCSPRPAVCMRADYSISKAS